jgi:hypothetical protein
MKRRTLCARRPLGSITQSDGRSSACMRRSWSSVPRRRPAHGSRTNANVTAFGGRSTLRASLGPLFLIVAMLGCQSKTKTTGDLLASLDTELSRTEVEVQKCLRVLDEQSGVLASKLSLLHDTHQRAMFRNYANVLPLVRAEDHARKSFDAFFNQRTRCQGLETHGIALRERLVATIAANERSVPQAWLARSAWFEKDLLAAKSRASDVTAEATKLSWQADSEFAQVKLLRTRGCVTLGKCESIRQAEALVAAEGETGRVAPVSTKRL